MKKVALSLLAFGLIGTAAFADGPTVTIGDWARQITAVGSSSDGYWINTGASWGGAPRIVGLNIQAKTDNAGFSITPSADNGSFGLTDQNKAWIKPIDGLTVETGIDIETDSWRGADGFGSWNFLRFAKEKGDNVTFSRMGNNGSGYQTAVNYNKDGIGFWADWYLGGTGSTISESASTTSASGYAYSLGYNNPAGTSALGDPLQIGAAYTITGVGQIKAQYLGNNAHSEERGSVWGSQVGKKPFGEYQVAFNLSAVKDLSAEVAVQVPTASANAGYTYQISAVAGYTVDKSVFHLEVIDVAYTDDQGVAGAGIGGGIGLDYDLGDSVGISTDVRLNNSLANTSGAADDKKGFGGFSLGVTKGFSNGLIGIAFEYAAGGAFTFGATDSSKANWAIPVRLEQWF
jgi:hypothetical protein